LCSAAANGRLGLEAFQHLAAWLRTISDSIAEEVLGIARGGTAQHSNRIVHHTQDVVAKDNESKTIPPKTGSANLGRRSPWFRAIFLHRSQTPAPCRSVSRSSIAEEGGIQQRYGKCQVSARAQSVRSRAAPEIPQTRKPNRLALRPGPESCRLAKAKPQRSGRRCSEVAGRTLTRPRPL